MRHRGGLRTAWQHNDCQLSGLHQALLPQTRPSGRDGYRSDCEVTLSATNSDSPTEGQRGNVSFRAASNVKAVPVGKNLHGVGKLPSPVKLW